MPRVLTRPARRAALVLLSTVLALAGCAPADLWPLPPHDGPAVPPAAPADPQTPLAPEMLLPVEAVEVQVLESFPVQVQAIVTGYLPDSCTELGATTQTRAGTDVTVTITVTRPAGALCAAVITPVEQVIALDGEFPPGSYTVTVNGLRQSFTV